MAKKESQQIDIRDAFRLVLLAIDGRLTKDERRKAFEGLNFKSYAELAKYAEVRVATVRHTWKPNGLPSVGVRGSGSTINAADTLDWLDVRNVKNTEARGTDEFTKRKREAETLTAEAEARIKQLKIEQSEGEYAPVPMLLSIIGTMANRLRDAFLRLPDKYKPTWPSKYAQEWSTNMETDIRAILTMASEIDETDIREQLNQEQ